MPINTSTDQDIESILLSNSSSINFTVQNDLIKGHNLSISIDKIILKYKNCKVKSNIVSLYFNMFHINLYKLYYANSTSTTTMDSDLQNYFYNQYTIFKEYQFDNNLFVLQFYIIDNQKIDKRFITGNKFLPLYNPIYELINNIPNINSRIMLFNRSLLFYMWIPNDKIFYQNFCFDYNILENDKTKIILNSYKKINFDFTNITYGFTPWDVVSHLLHIFTNQQCNPNPVDIYTVSSGKVLTSYISLLTLLNPTGFTRPATVLPSSIYSGFIPLPEKRLSSTGALPAAQLQMFEGFEEMSSTSFDIIGELVNSYINNIAIPILENYKSTGSGDFNTIVSDIVSDIKSRNFEPPLPTPPLPTPPLPTPPLPLPPISPELPGAKDMTSEDTGVSGKTSLGITADYQWAGPNAGIVYKQEITPVNNLVTPKITFVNTPMVNSAYGSVNTIVFLSNANILYGSNNTKADGNIKLLNPKSTTGDFGPTIFYNPASTDSNFHSSNVTSIAINNKSTIGQNDLLMVSISNTENKINIWKINPMTQLPLALIRTITKPSSTFTPVTSVVFSPSGTYIATTLSGANTFSLYPLYSTTATGVKSLLASGSQNMEITPTAAFHTAAITCVAFHPRAPYMASGSIDKTIVIWQITYSAYEVITSINYSSNPLSYSPSGSIINGSITSIAFSPLGNNIVAGSEDSKIYIWSLNIITTPITSSNAIVLSQHTSRVNTVVFFPTGLHFASGSNDNTIIIWKPTYDGNNIIGALPILTLPDHKSPITSIAFSLDGMYMASGSTNGTLIYWGITLGPIEFFEEGSGTSCDQKITYKIIYTNNNDINTENPLNILTFNTVKNMLVDKDDNNKEIKTIIYNDGVIDTNIFPILIQPKYNYNILNYLGKGEQFKNSLVEKFTLLSNVYIYIIIFIIIVIGVLYLLNQYKIINIF
jgi:WD40 repeat protein